MLKGSQNLSESDAKELSALALSIQAFENEHIPLPKPQSLQAMVEWKMFELRLKQSDLAKLLNEPTSRISELINGKRPITLKMAKKLHKSLNIPADFIFEHA